MYTTAMRNLLALALLTLLRVTTGTTLASAAALVPGQWSTGAQRFSPREKYHLTCFPNGTVVLVGGRAADGKKSDFWTGSRDSGTGLLTWSETYLGGSVTGREAMTQHYVNDVFYMFGGRTDQTNGVDELWTIRNGRWRQMPTGTIDWPLGRYRHQGITLASGDAFLVMFGTSEDRHYNDVWMFNATTSGWTELHSGAGPISDVPSPRFDPCCQLRVTTNSVVCFGGTKYKGDSNEVWEFSLSNKTWQQHQITPASSSGDVPSARRLAICSLVSPDVLVLWAGYSSNDSDNAPAETTHVLNLATKTWTAVAQLSDGPMARDGAHMCPVPNANGVLMFGGLDKKGQWLNDIWELNTTTYVFSRRQAALSLPASRSEHSAVVIGSKMLILFGLGTGGLLQDTWQMQVEEEGHGWSQLSAKCLFGPRRAAAAVARGNSVLVMGGYTADGPTSELLSFDVTSRVWKKIPTVNAPIGRYRHSAVLVDTTNLLIIGGTTAAAGRTSDMFLYDPSTSRWSQVEEVGATLLPARRSLGLVHNPSTGALTVLGGKNSAVLMDRWSLTVNATDTTHPTAVATQLPSSIGDPGEVERQYIRSEAAVVGSGRHYIVCGGAISASFPVPEESACYQYDSVSGNNTQMEPMPVASYMSSGVYIKNTLYVFGGNLIQNAIKATNTYLNLVQQFNFDLPCASLDANDANCIHCAAGSTASVANGNPVCSLSPAGYYRETNATALTACGEGRYSWMRGAQDSLFCLPCPDGSYNNVSGQSRCLPCPAGQRCPVGTSTPRASSEIVKSTNNEMQPADFVTDQGIPIPTLFAIAGGWVLAALLILLVALLEHTRWTSLSRYYIPQEADSRIASIYFSRLVDETGKGASRGIAGNELLDALSDVAQYFYQWTSDEVEERISEKAVNEMVDFFDQSGTQYLKLIEFKLIVCMLFEKQFFKAMPGTPYEATGIIRPVKRPTIALEDLDLFATKHRFWKMGEAVRTQETRMGGVMSLVGVVAILAWATILVVLFFTDNVEETQSMLPKVTVNEQISAQLQLTVQTRGENNVDYCVEPGTESTCIEGSRVTLPPSLVIHSGSMVPQCHFASPGYCTMDWTCEDCTFTNASNTVSFLFGHPDWYSTETVMTVSVDSGIREGFGSTTIGYPVQSLLSQVVAPSIAGRVLKGYPASSLTVSGVPTTWNAPRTVIDLRRVRSSGYHISEPSAIVGNEAPVSELPTHVGVPVDITFEISAGFLVIERWLKKDAVTLSSSILGLLTGVMAIAAAILSVNDRVSKWVHYPEEDNEQRILARAPRFDSVAATVSVHHRKRKLINIESDNLARVCNFRRHQAKALVEAMTKISNAAAGKAFTESGLGEQCAPSVPLGPDEDLQNKSKRRMSTLSGLGDLNMSSRSDLNMSRSGDSSLDRGETNGQVTTGNPLGNRRDSEVVNSPTFEDEVFTF